ncbi:hypothetical protein Btru_078012 [Bulinus truncatus]|nr:hypothetical protein Btru_078012 [Bulinus truncatus]
MEDLDWSLNTVWTYFRLVTGGPRFGLSKQSLEDLDLGSQSLEDLDLEISQQSLWRTDLALFTVYGGPRFRLSYSHYGGPIFGSVTVTMEDLDLGSHNSHYGGPVTIEYLDLGSPGHWDLDLRLPVTMEDLDGLSIAVTMEYLVCLSHYGGPRFGSHQSMELDLGSHYSHYGGPRFRLTTVHYVDLDLGSQYSHTGGLELQALTTSHYGDLGGSHHSHYGEPRFRLLITMED